MNSVHVIHYAGATAKSSSVLASVALDYKDGGADVTVVDLAKTTTIQQGLPSPWIARLFGHRVMRPSVTEVLREFGVVYLTLPLAHNVTQIATADLKEMQQALESELLTYFRRDDVPNTAESRRLEVLLRNRMHDVYRSLESLWLANPPDLVAIPNGRTSRQKAARLVAERLGIQVWFYENGRAIANSYYLGKTQPHDRVASQAEILEGFPLPEDDLVSQQASAWLLERQATASGTNSFSREWTAVKRADAQVRKTEPVAAFFASSFDEFLAFGPMWQIDNWATQFEAFDLIMSALEMWGFNLVLRLHPNLATKSRKYFRREVSEIFALQKKHPKLKVHWHNDRTNSYDLVENASLVVVERSTIGLEASLLGKPVIACQATQWDKVADVRQILEQKDITLEALTPWETSPIGARRFVAYWMAQEYPLRFEWNNWSTWNPENPPMHMKLAQLSLRNSWRHKIRLITLEIAKNRNSRFQPPHHFKDKLG